MIKIENVEVLGWEAAIRGMRNPMNSWEKSDSECLFHALPNYSYDDPKAEEYTRYLDAYNLNLKLGPNDHDLMMRLRNAGTDHRKFMRMIVVYADVIAPLYWWKEFDTYKVGTVANSCSTMHKIHAKEFTMDDFSHDKLIDIWDFEPEVRDLAPVVEADVKTDVSCHYVYGPDNILTLTVNMLNKLRELYLKTKDKTYWYTMIQLLPTSYNQRRTVQLNYEVLANMYKSRKGHRLDEWNSLCSWIETLPYHELITGGEKIEEG